MIDSIRVLEYLMKENIAYPEKGIGTAKLAHALKLSPNRVIRALKPLRIMGLVVRNIDSRRKKFSRWALSRDFVDHKFSLSVKDIIDHALGRCVVVGRKSFIEWLDSFLDNYIISGTMALMLRGLCWNEIMPNGVLIVAERKEKKALDFIRRVMNSEGLGDKFCLGIVFVNDIRKYDYEILQFENSAIPIASVSQAIVDSIVHYKKVGVDLLETLGVLIGILIPEVLERDDNLLRDIVKISRNIYPSKWELVIGTLRIILMKLFIYFADPKAMKFYLELPSCAIEIPSEIVKRVNEAFRMTILGNKVAAMLGLEPDFMSEVKERISGWLFSVVEPWS